jgi:hypothetical protein
MNACATLRVVRFASVSVGGLLLASTRFPPSSAANRLALRLPRERPRPSTSPATGCPW